MKKFYILALVAAMFAACATDVTEDVAIEAPETLKVSFEESSRIQLDNGKTVWTADDLVSVFYLSNANQKWQYQGETGERTGNLKQVEAGKATETMKRVVIVYPYNENYYINTDTYNVKGWLPAEQTYLADSYGLNGNIMISQSEYNQFSLKNVCGWLKLQLTGNGEKVQSIKLKGNNGEQVAGEVYINSSDATASLAADMGSADDNDNSAGGNLVFEDTILTEVTLNCGDGVTLSAEPTAFYIALPPQTFGKGLTVEVACSDGSTMTKSTEKEVVIARNTILPMAVLEYEGALPEVFELAYTTNDGKPLDPLTTEGFGANFVENVFDPATGKGALKFNGKITIIPAKAFVACTNLTQIEFTKDITAINASAFSNCTALAVMDIPQGVKSIGNEAFYNCSGMTEITIPSSVTSIGTSSFKGCVGKANINCIINSSDFATAKFTEVVIGNSVTSIGDFAFGYCSSLTSVTIGNSVTSIEEKAFQYCTSLTSVTIPDSVTEIGRYAFSGCTSLTSVTIPGSVTSIRQAAFDNCSSLTSVTIPDRVTEIGGGAFQNCISLTSVTIGKGVTSIGDCAFYKCPSLKEVYCKPTTPPSIGDYLFDNYHSVSKIYVPRTSVGAYKTTSYWRYYNIEPYDFE
ncbi:MAG: leucine-rich repeat domain-containing protein [Rikenellaceae bacterium]|nr:leucine-rich repeat domain-containing protein [Rikenellaceae bacterium]